MLGALVAEYSRATLLVAVEVEPAAPVATDGQPAVDEDMPHRVFREGIGPRLPADRLLAALRASATSVSLWPSAASRKASSRLGEASASSTTAAAPAFLTPHGSRRLQLPWALRLCLHFLVSTERLLE